MKHFCLYDIWIFVSAFMTLKMACKNSFEGWLVKFTSMSKSGSVKLKQCFFPLKIKMRFLSDSVHVSKMYNGIILDSAGGRYETCCLRLVDEAFWWNWRPSVCLVFSRDWGLIPVLGSVKTKIDKKSLGAIIYAFIWFIFKMLVVESCVSLLLANG